MQQAKTIWMVAAALLLLTPGCDWGSTSEFEPEYVVEAYIGAGEPLEQVRLSRSADLEGAYEFDENAVDGAQVEMQLLGSDGAVEKSFSFVQRSRHGIYEIMVMHRAVPLRTYRLIIQTADGTRLSSETTVPAAIYIESISADTVIYKGPQPLEADLRTGSGNEGNRVFTFVSEALDPSEENLTDFARSIYEQGDVQLADLSRTSSPVLNEAGYGLSPEGRLRIALPWVAISFYGRNRLSVASLDKNYYDFRRTLDVQQGGSTLGPGEIPNVLDPINGGRGIFASFARAWADIYVKRPE